MNQPLRNALQLAARHPQRGSILLLVLVVVAMLALGTNTYLELMQTEHRAVRRHGRAAQSLRLAESGSEYLKTVLAKTPADIQLGGGLYNNLTAMQAQLADDQTSDFDRGRFTILAPAQAAGLYMGTRYGLENESAKLNLHTLLPEATAGEARQRLLALPSMTPDIADAILDWLDDDDMPREFGAEVEYYSTLTPPYTARNGPIAGIDELIQVRGVTPELLYGFDQNRNYLVDLEEQVARGALVEVDNSEGLMNRGWSAYLTLSSVELLGGSAATKRIDLNAPDLQTLYNTLKTALNDEQAKFIILYRQHGTPPQQAGSGTQPGGQGESGGGQPGVGGSGSESAGQGGANSGAAAADTSDGRQPGGGNVTELSSIQLNFQQPGNVQIASLLDLIGATVTVPPSPAEAQPGQEGGGGAGGSGSQSGEQNSGSDSGGSDSSGDSGADSGDSGEGQSGGGQGGGSGGESGGGGEGGESPPPQTVQSPWHENPTGFRDLMSLYDVGSAGPAGRVAGRVNISAASRPVLLGVPYLTPATVERILATREPEPSPTLSPQRSVLWLLVDGLVNLPTLRTLDRYITAGGDAFSGQTVGFFDADSAPVRAEFVLDRSVSPPRLRHWRDLSTSGPGFAPATLGAPVQ